MPKLGLALAVVAGILAVLGLAALGWGGVAPFLAIPPASRSRWSRWC